MRCWGFPPSATSAPTMRIADQVRGAGPTQERSQLSLRWSLNPVATTGTWPIALPGYRAREVLTALVVSRSPTHFVPVAEDCVFPIDCSGGRYKLGSNGRLAQDFSYRFIDSGVAGLDWGSYASMGLCPQQPRREGAFPKPPSTSAPSPSPIGGGAAFFATCQRLRRVLVA